MDLHDLGGKPINMWVADSAVVQKSKVSNVDGIRASNGRYFRHRAHNLQKSFPAKTDGTCKSRLLPYTVSASGSRYLPMQ